MVDVVRLEDGSLAEHWNVIQDKAARETSKAGLFTFGDKFPDQAQSSSHVKTRRKRTQNQFQIAREIKSAPRREASGKSIGDKNGSNLQSDRDNEARNFSPCREACRGAG